MDFKMKTNIKNASRGILILLTVVLTVFMVACSNSDMRSWVASQYGITVNVQVVTVASNTTAHKWVSGDFNSYQINQLNDAASNDYDISIAGNPTTKYNCHSYAWHYQNINNIHWINDPVEFRKNHVISSNPASNTIPSSVQNGDRVDYYNSGSDRPHSAVVINKSSTRPFASKWSFGGLYLHKPTDTPYNDGVVSYSAQFGYYRVSSYM